MSKMLKALNDKGEEIFLVVFLSLTVLLVIAQVFSRYIFSMSLGWSEEIARFSLIWITWISTSYAIKKKSHIRVEVVKNLFSTKIKKIIDGIVYVVWFILAGFLLIQGIDLVLSIQSTGQVTPSTQLPMWIIYVATPIGGLLMCIRLVQEFVNLFRKETNESEGIIK